MNLELNDFYAVLIGVIITLNGISVPLSYNIVSENLKPYLGSGMYKEFLKERKFWLNILVSFWCLAWFGVGLISDMKIDKECSSLLKCAIQCHVVISLFSIVGFLISFVEFSLLIYEYGANTEEVVFRKMKERIDKELKQKA